LCARFEGVSYIFPIILDGKLRHDLEIFLAEIFRALCLVLVIEGILPFMWPDRFRNLLETVAHIDDRTLRAVGLFSMLLGVGLLYLL